MPDKGKNGDSWWNDSITRIPHNELNVFCYIGSCITEEQSSLL